MERGIDIDGTGRGNNRKIEKGREIKIECKVERRGRI